MSFKPFAIFPIFLFLLGCQSIINGGAIPYESNKNLKLNVLNIDWGDLSLAVGDRRIENSGFIIANFHNVPGDGGLSSGALGVLAADSAYEKNLGGSIEKDLRDNFDLAKILLKSLKNDSKLEYEIKSIHLNEHIQKEVIILEPSCIIFVNEQGLGFLPQLKATLKSATGKILWQSYYAPVTNNKPLSIDNSLSNENIKILKSRLNLAYKEITNQLVANIQGHDKYVSGEENKKFNDKLMESMKIELDESLFNIQ